MKMRLSNRRAKPGFTLLEVIVAMTLLATSLVAIAGFAAVNSRRARSIGDHSQVTAALQTATNQYLAMPFDWIETTTASFSSPFPHTRQVTVTESGNRAAVRIKVVPTNALIKPDSIQLVRTRPGSSPLHKVN
jgi:prepilin-type N-terminal cleavage/methylation domain-containing protein